MRRVASDDGADFAMFSGSSIIVQLRQRSLGSAQPFTILMQWPEKAYCRFVIVSS